MPRCVSYAEIDALIARTEPPKTGEPHYEVTLTPTEVLNVHAVLKDLKQCRRFIAKLRKEAP